MVTVIDRHLPFNSLCEILSPKAIAKPLPALALSILFVRFTLADCDEIFTFNAFNSLCEILRGGLTGWTCWLGFQFSL